MPLLLFGFFCLADCKLVDKAEKLWPHRGCERVLYCQECAEYFLYGKVYKLTKQEGLIKGKGEETFCCRVPWFLCSSLLGWTVFNFFTFHYVLNPSFNGFFIYRHNVRYNDCIVGEKCMGFVFGHNAKKSIKKRKNFNSLKIKEHWMAHLPISRYKLMNAWFKTPDSWLCVCPLIMSTIIFYNFNV